MSADDERYAQKLAARRDGKATVQTYAANPLAVVHAVATDPTTARFEAKLAARAKAEADAKAAKVAPVETVASEPEPEVKAPAEVDAKTDGKPGNKSDRR